MGPTRSPFKAWQIVSECELQVQSVPEAACFGCLRPNPLSFAGIVAMRDAPVGRLSLVASVASGWSPGDSACCCAAFGSSLFHAV